MTMRRKALFAAASAILAAITVVALPTATANAHGYIITPPSRQANCKAGAVPNCGAIIWEPQSVEGPKGLTSCSGGVPRFAELDDGSKPWPAASAGKSVTFTWTFTARHATLNFQYYIGSTLLATFAGNNQQPPEGLQHTVDLGNFSGRQKLLAVWNIGDTANAFYSCVDLQIGGGGTTPPVTTPPTTTNPPTTSTPPGSTTWTAWTQYKVGDVVTYSVVSYRCITAHQSIPGWEPPNTPTLWQRQ